MRVGAHVVVPVPSYKYATRPSSQPREYTTTPDGDQIIYTVHRGETLGQIGRQLGVSVNQICSENGISDQNRIQPGQKLRITVKGQPTYASKSSGEKQYHTVRRGDTVWSIAQTYRVDTTTILRWNNLSRSGRIYPGQKLIVNQ
ncbi:LysM peptidoglycan-binding domain-containing protein [bacterium]|nr:MAG: LysM peptidoglycan-binding domain-containing protein [bacterium]